MILCPSRELARQTFEGISFFSEALYKAGYPKLKTLLCIGGTSIKDQVCFSSGVPLIV
jgi:ATP-dependent RNA helicase DDX41